MTIEVDGLHHFLIRVQDPERARRFYEQTFGFTFLELPVDATFVAAWKGRPAEGTLFATQLGSTFLLFAPPLEGTPEEDRFNERRVGVDHLAFGVSDPAMLDEVVAALTNAGVPTAGVETDPVLGKRYVAFRDPENVQWEFFVTA
jgi:glyoxylase I family protein